MTPTRADRSRWTPTLNVNAQRDHAQAPLVLSRFHPSTLPSWAMPEADACSANGLPCCTAPRAGGAGRSP